MNRPCAPPPAADADPGNRVAAFRAEMAYPRISRTRWMECQALLAALFRKRQLRASIAAAIDELDRRPNHPLLRKRMAGWLHELRRLEECE